MPSSLIIVDYADVASDPSVTNLSDQLSRAFGGHSTSSNDNNDPPDSSSTDSSSSPLGLIAIRNVPSFLPARDAFLPMAHRLAHLPPSYLDNDLSDPTSFYNAGWSHGREKLGDAPDLAKASYYFNPLTDVPGSEEERKAFPASYPCNVWPDEERMKMEGFKDAACELGGIMHKVSAHLARHLDDYAEKRVVGYKKGLLFGAMEKTEKAKGRLLYYFPNDGNNGGEGSEEETGASSSSNNGETKPKFDDWIGWHNDSGFLTALAGDMYVDDDTGEPLPPSSVDPAAGLYVTDRSGASVRVEIPKDCLAIQLGECVQIVTGGVVAATPHCVRGPRSGWTNGVDTSDSEDAAAPSTTRTTTKTTKKIRVARISHPCFIDTPPTFPLTSPPGCDRMSVARAGVGNDKVPPLERRWTEDGMKFGEFLGKTFETYYDWGKERCGDDGGDGDES